MTTHDDPASGAEGKGTKARFQEAWQSTLGRFATADEGSRNLVHRLVDWGKLTGDEGRSLLSDWREAIEENRRQLEKRVEEAVQRSMARFTLPSQNDIDQLTDQIAGLEQRVRELLDRQRSTH